MGRAGETACVRHLGNRDGGIAHHGLGLKRRLCRTRPPPRAQEIATNGTTIHVRVGGKGPAVVLFHVYGDTGDMWGPLAAELIRDHTVVIPDLRGMVLSAVAGEGFSKINQAEDVAGVMDALHVREADAVAHDIRNIVAFAQAHPDRTTHLVLMDAPVPGVGPWEEILKNPLLWHFRFGSPDKERLVAGRERIYLDRFCNEFSADPAHFPEEARRHYAELYARPGLMMPVSCNSSPSIRMPSTTVLLWRRGVCRFRCWPLVAIIPSGPPWRLSCALPPTMGINRSSPGPATG